MVIFREVEVWPHGGFADRPWSPEPDEDAFARAARGVCEVYSQALPPLRLRGKAALLRLTCHGDHLGHAGLARPGPQDPVRDAVTVSTPFIESAEDGHVRVPAGFAALPAARQRAWALDAAHEACRQLAQIRGWDPDALDTARGHAVARELRYVWEGTWKAAPDRRHKARGVAGIAENGMGWARLDLATHAGDPVASSDEVPASCDAEDLRWLCKTVRWTSRTQVTMVAAVDPYGMRPQVRLALSTIGEPAPPPGPRQIRLHPPRRAPDVAQ